MGDLIADVRDLMRQGLGCEDIAVQLEIPVEGVRRMMKRWQMNGAMKSILKNEVGDTRGLPRIALTETPTIKEKGHGLN